MSETEKIRELLSYDPLGEAEKVTGESYKTDEETSAIGFGLHIMHNKDKQRILSEAGDTHYGMSLHSVLSTYRGAWFRPVFTETFRNTEGVQESYHLLWHPEGILAEVESYGVTGCNRHAVYYNLRLDPDFDGSIWGRASSGHLFTEAYDLGEKIWIGYYTGYDGVMNHLNGLREIGEFLPEWVESPVLTLANYMDWQRWRNLDWKTRETKYVENTRRIIDHLPEYVQTSLRRDRRYNNNESE